MKNIIFSLLQTFILSSIVLLAVVPLSCNSNNSNVEGIHVMTGDFVAPELKELRVLDSKTLQIDFSEPVSISSAIISPQILGKFDSGEHSLTMELSEALKNASGGYGKINTEVQISQDGNVVNFILDTETQIGKSYELYAVAKDNNGNSLSFCAEFIGYNPRIPKIIMTEVQTKYIKAKLAKGDEFRAEFVELLALTDGNLYGLEIYSAYDTEENAFILPPIEVHKGQIILVHPRVAGEGCISEDSENLDTAYGYNCVDGILDLWDENTKSRYNDKADIIVIKNMLDNTILDAVFYVEEDAVELKAKVQEYADLISELTVPHSSKGMTPLNSLNRIDAQQLKQKTLENQEIQYPICVGQNSWQIKRINPGTL